MEFSLKVSMGGKPFGVRVVEGVDWKEEVMEDEMHRQEIKIFKRSQAKDT